MSQYNKIDKRVIKTTNSLKLSLVSLLEETKIEDISVIALTEKAGINRKTFYLHYKDVNEVYKEIIDNLSEKMANFIKSMPTEILFDEDSIYSIFSLIYNDEFVVYLLKKTMYAKRIMSKFETVILESIFERFLNKHSKEELTEVNTTIAFNVFGCSRVFLTWLRETDNNNLREIAAKLAALTQQIEA